jgi:hypothetical protein
VGLNCFPGNPQGEHVKAINVFLQHPILWKDDNGEAKPYLVIYLLNCISKTVEKVAAIPITEVAERGKSHLHIGQFGERKGGGAVDAATRLIVG